MLIAGTHDLTVDPKNRLSVPAGIRSKLETEGQGSTFYLVPGLFAGSLRLYPEKYFEAHVEERHASLESGEEKDIFEAVFFAQSTLVEVDKQGRVVLPQRMLDGAGISRQVTISGCRDHLILWDRGEYEQFMARNAARSNDLAERARLKKRLNGQT